MLQLKGVSSDLSFVLLRVVSGLMFSFHGLQKIGGVLTDHQPPFGTQLWWGGLIELVCGLAIAAGSFTRTAIAARRLDAELVTLAWSGKGVVYNYDTDVADPMPALYGRTLPESAASVWDFSLVADAVVINLGTNDFSTDGDPAPELFEREYRALLERVRVAYPDAFVLCTVGPLLGGADLAAARSGIASAVAAFEAAGGSNVGVWEMNVPNDNPGCDYHPSLATHAAMAEGLIERLGAVFTP